MDLNINNVNPAFSAKFVNTKTFREVVDYAKETNQLHALDTALHSLSKANKGDILIVHGKTENGAAFSNMICGRRSSLNFCRPNQDPREASFEGIIQLGTIGRKFKSLFGADLESSVTADKIIEQYTPKVSV